MNLPARTWALWLPTRSSLFDKVTLMENLFTQDPSTIIKELVLIVYRTFNRIIFFI